MVLYPLSVFPFFSPVCCFTSFHLAPFLLVILRIVYALPAFPSLMLLRVCSFFLSLSFPLLSLSPFTLYFLSSLHLLLLIPSLPRFFLSCFCSYLVSLSPLRLSSFHPLLFTFHLHICFYFLSSVPSPFCVLTHSSSPLPLIN